MPDSRTLTFRGHDARDNRRIDAAVADGWCWRAEAGGEGHAVEAETEQRSRRRARQSIREYVLIWLLQQRLRAKDVNRFGFGVIGNCQLVTKS